MTLQELKDALASGKRVWIDGDPVTADGDGWYSWRGFTWGDRLEQILALAGDRVKVEGETDKVMKVTDGVYKEGDVATAPNGNKWERDDDAMWFDPCGMGVRDSGLDDGLVKSLGLEVTREAPPEPPAFLVRECVAVRHLYGEASFRALVLPDNVNVGKEFLVCRDTPENRAALEGLQDDGWETLPQTTKPGYQGYNTHYEQVDYEYRVQRRPVKDAPAQGGKR